jgi:hypothetical protein
VGTLPPIGHWVVEKFTAGEGPGGRKSEQRQLQSRLGLERDRAENKMREESGRDEDERGREMKEGGVGWHRSS